MSKKLTSLEEAGAVVSSRISGARRHRRASRRDSTCITATAKATSKRQLRNATKQVNKTPKAAPASLAKPARLTARGFAGRGLGRASYVEAPPEWRGTTVQACGLYPFVVGASTPMVGVPIGPSLSTGATVCCDPINWFQRAKLISNPSMFVLGLPGLGKSTLIRRQVLGLAAQGVTPLVLGDLKPDYADLVRELGGQVVRLGRGLGSLNVLDAGALDEAADLLQAAGMHRRADRLREEAHGRRLNMVDALILLARQSSTTDTERTVLSAALRLLAERRADAAAYEGTSEAPLLSDLVAVLEEGPPVVRLPTLDRGDVERYRVAVEPLQRSLLALIEGPLGSVFARPTTERIRLDSTAVCVDVSGISANDTALQAAVLLACWNEGFGAVEAANELADAGLAPQRRYFVVLDELWRVLRSGAGMVDRVDSVSRLNRQEGVGQAYCSHSMADLKSMQDPADIAKAKGLVERAGIVVVAGLPPAELKELAEVVGFTDAEVDTVTSWSTPRGWDEGEGPAQDAEEGDRDARPGSEPPGRGKLLIKVGQRPGIPVQLQLTRAERRSAVHNTNKRWVTDLTKAAGSGLAPTLDLTNAGAERAGAVA
ncbi:ATP/GTP-binding protein [Motilibacter aurantiacus]|uniref:ATP/GTP-binding protein n=1 Tax=Motilibacter aurantiacus TaxID=2714955 RepID=UPI0018C8AC48|nr:ATP/GTP-binding protein [Motilibacter aurantiacus]